MVHNRAAVEILFPVTARLPHYPNWTVDGIIEYTHSEEFKTMVLKLLFHCLQLINTWIFSI